MPSDGAYHGRITSELLVKVIKAAAHSALKAVKDGGDIEVYDTAIQNGFFSLMAGIRTQELETIQFLDTVLDTLEDEELPIRRYILHQLVETVINFKSLEDRVQDLPAFLKKVKDHEIKVQKEKN